MAFTYLIQYNKSKFLPIFNNLCLNQKYKCIHFPHTYFTRNLIVKRLSQAFLALRLRVEFLVPSSFLAYLETPMSRGASSSPSLSGQRACANFLFPGWNHGGCRVSFSSSSRVSSSIPETKALQSLSLSVRL